MKNGKKLFILIEIILALIVFLVAFRMVLEKADKDVKKVSVIVQNSDDSQWASFKYGLKMAAQDEKVEVFVVSTREEMTAEEEMELIENEIKNGVDAIIVQPLAGSETKKTLQKTARDVTLMLVEDMPKLDKKERTSLPVTKPDYYAMGKALAQEVRKDYNGNLEGKTIGVVSKTRQSEATKSKERGFQDGIESVEGKGEISWFTENLFLENGESLLKSQTKVDIIVALDNNSLLTVGELTAVNDLHGAIVYGIGNSMEAFYYLDIGLAKCIVMPDEFNVGYESLIHVAEQMKYSFRKLKDITVSYTVIRRDTLFSEENQNILFTMSQ